MTQKQHALEVISKLPDRVTLEDIIEELCFRDKVQRGLDDVEHGRVVAHEEAKQRLAQWLQK